MTPAPKRYVPEDLHNTILALRSRVNYCIVSSKYNLSSCCIKPTMLKLEKYEQDKGQELTDDENKKRFNRWTIKHKT